MWGGFFFSYNRKLIICISLEVQSCYFCSVSVPARRLSTKKEVEIECTVCPYMYSALTHKWQPSLLVLSYCPQKASEQFNTRCLCVLDTTHPRWPETLHRTGFTGTGCVAAVFWSLICCWVNRIFLWLVSGFSGKTGQPPAGNFWSLGDRSAGMSRAAWRLLPTSTTSHINNLPGWSVRADYWMNHE